MSEPAVTYKPIGVVRSEQIVAGRTPIQHTAKFDRIDTTRNGWQDAVDEETARQRGRRGYVDVPTRGPDGDVS